MVVDTLRKHAPTTGHKDNHHGVPTYWSKSGHTLQKFITALATCDFLLFGFDVSPMLTDCGLVWIIRGAGQLTGNSL